MERLEKLVNILKLTPHRQPELVKEATCRILSRQLRHDPQAPICYLKPLLEILIQYCDSDDSAQRSIFNDLLNNLLLAFQQQHFALILATLLDEITANKSARTVSIALHRVPLLIQNVRPIQLVVEQQKILKSLLVATQRFDDEAVMKAVDVALKQLMPYLNYRSKDNNNQQLFATIADTLLKNVNNESSQVKRLAANSLASLCSQDKLLQQEIVNKFENQLTSLSGQSNPSPNELVGFCLCVKEIHELAKRQHETIIKLIMKQIEVSDLSNTGLLVVILETFKELLNFQLDSITLDDSAKLLATKFLIHQDETGHEVVRSDIKVVLQASAFICISTIIKQRPQMFHMMNYLLLFSDHSEVILRNQLILTIGNYIRTSWSLPNSIERPTQCAKIRSLWTNIRSILNDANAHPDLLKSCVTAIKTCLNAILESDHCVHIVEYSDFDRLITLYLKSNFKPFKLEVLSLFASINYRTLHYLERYHWLKMKQAEPGSMITSLQNTILNHVIISSLIDEHQRVRVAATKALVDIIPNLYITHIDGSSKIALKNSDPIVSLAQDLANEHLVVLEQTNEHIGSFKESESSMPMSEIQDKSGCRSNHAFLSSSILQLYDNPFSEHGHSRVEAGSKHSKMNISINLTHVIELLKSLIENSLDKGKTSVSSLVRTLYELTLVYPVYQYPRSWDCRPSEYCDSITLLNFVLVYMENLNEPNVIIEDLEAYKNFLALSHQLLYALCHESVINDYEHQKMKPYHKRLTTTRISYWTDLTLKHPYIESLLDAYFIHLTRLLSLAASIIEEQTNPVILNLKQTTNQPHSQFPPLNHSVLTSSPILFNSLYKKLESSFKSSKKNLNQRDEKFYQIVDSCINSISSLLEFIGMTNSKCHAKDILSYLRITSNICNVSSIICARQLLKSLFGINILALYQLDPEDCFEDDSWPTNTTNSMTQSQESFPITLHGVYHHLVTEPYATYSSYYSSNCSLTPTTDKALAILSYETRRALKIRRRIEERVKSLFEYNPHQLTSPQVRQVSELLKSLISDFTPIVNICMNQFNSRGFCDYQCEILHFMSYLVLLRVNYQKLSQAGDLIISINTLLDQSAKKVFIYRNCDLKLLLRNSFTFLTLLSHDRGASSPMFPIATVIQKLDDIRASLVAVKTNEDDVSTYVIPLLRCLIEDLFIYRTSHFQNQANKSTLISSEGGDQTNFQMTEISSKPLDKFEALEAERDTVAQKLLDVISNPQVYDLLSIMILESRQNSSDIKYKKLSQNLLSVLPVLLSKRKVNLLDYSCIELTRRVIENISPEIFQPINFIYETLMKPSKPVRERTSKGDFQRWLSLVNISMHILINQVKEGVFLCRLREVMSDEVFVEDLLHTAQICIAEILLCLTFPNECQPNDIKFACQHLSSYLLYLTSMFQSGAFCQLSKAGTDLIRRKVQEDDQSPKSFRKLCVLGRDPINGFSLHACEKLFDYIKILFPDLTILWSNVMMLLNNVDCNRDFWRNLLVHECSNCLPPETMTTSFKNLSLGSSTDKEPMLDIPVLSSPNDKKFKRSCNGPSSLNLSDITLNDQLRRSFIKRIAASEINEKTSSRNVVDKSDQDAGVCSSRDNATNDLEHCLCPNIELVRRGALCIALDFVTISMNDVEHITWLILHHINDIIRWCHESPITEFINAVHGNSASSGIFIQAINNSVSDHISSISFVARLLWTLQNVHYTQYGSLIVLLVEKLLSSADLLAYRSLTRNIEDFACETVEKLLNETNKSLVATNEEVVNQLEVDDLDRISSLLHKDLYPKLTKLLTELRETTSKSSSPDTPKFEFHVTEDWTDSEDSEASPIIQSAAAFSKQEDEDALDMVMITPDSLSRDHTLVERFCERLLKHGWNNRRQFEEAWNTLLGVLSSALSISSTNTKESIGADNGLSDGERRNNLLISCRVITALTRLLLKSREEPRKQELYPTDQSGGLQSFDDKVHELIKRISTNLSSLKKRALPIFETIEVEKKLALATTTTSSLLSSQFSLVGCNFQTSCYSSYLKVSAQQLRMNVVLNIEMDMQDTVIIDNDREVSKDNDRIDVESCIRLLLSIYKQKLKESFDNQVGASSTNSTPSTTAASTPEADGLIEQSSHQQQISRQKNSHLNSKAPALLTSVCQSVAALSDFFTEYEQFVWLFESLIQMFKVAERNEDEIQMQYLVVGLCKATSVICYEIPCILNTAMPSSSQKEAIFEKCRHSVEKCVKSDFLPLKLNALYGAYYLLEDSINIVASGAWELDQFKPLRQSRLNWIHKLMPILLEKNNLKLLTKKPQTVKLLELLYETVTGVESTKAIKT